MCETIPGFEALNWFGMLAPANLPEAAQARLAKDIAEVLKKREIVERFAQEGVEVGGISREAFGAFLAVETVRWAKIIKTRNIKAD